MHIVSEIVCSGKNVNVCLILLSFRHYYKHRECFLPFIFPITLLARPVYIIFAKDTALYISLKMTQSPFGYLYHSLFPHKRINPLML